MNTVVARETLYAAYPGELPFEVVIEIGTPFPYDDSENEWICPLSIPALNRRNMHIHGATSLQALCLALWMARMELSLVREKGGTLGYTATSGDDFGLIESFGLADQAQ